ncbi:hypothetical protein Vretimale_4718 [Volvox reticuliferus]|uniref:Cytochrome c-553 n=2 Tax=Volvox reticuliferus TaxID=1737510 RepID=A0A8J4DCX9_9CHLO|nr:hypothetical protein Vretimale_4718 [Volvox reticuliferus]
MALTTVLSSGARTASAVAPAAKPAQRALYAAGTQRRMRTITAASAQHKSDPAAWRVPGASILSAAVIVLTVAPSSQAADLALGAQVFNGNCAACHQGGRNTVIAEKTLDKAALEQYLDGGFNIEAIIYQVENGKGAMPAWADRLSEEEIQSVAAYVYKQASEGLWKY